MEGFLGRDHVRRRLTCRFRRSPSSRCRATPTRHCSPRPNSRIHGRDAEPLRRKAETLRRRFNDDVLGPTRLVRARPRRSGTAASTPWRRTRDTRCGPGSPMTTWPALSGAPERRVDVDGLGDPHPRRRRWVRYDPLSYHNGSVWPHDTALCAAGAARYGRWDTRRSHRRRRPRRRASTSAVARPNCSPVWPEPTCRHLWRIRRRARRRRGRRPACRSCCGRRSGCSRLPPSRACRRSGPISRRSPTSPSTGCSRLAASADVRVSDGVLAHRGVAAAGGADVPARVVTSGG